MRVTAKDFEGIEMFNLVVAKGDTLADIADMAGTASIEQLKAINNIKNIGDIKENQVLQIPLEKLNDTYIVQDGETLEALADRFATSVATIKQDSGLDNPHRIMAGQGLHIPEALQIAAEMRGAVVASQENASEDFIPQPMPKPEIPKGRAA